MAADRRWEIDALRGLMLVLMTLTHLPTRWSDPLGQPFGFVSAAEGFVLLSAYMAGLVYTRRQLRRGDAELRRAFLARAWKIYLCQAALLLFLFGFVAAVGVVSRQPAVTDLVAFYLENPVDAFLAGLLLVYNPPLLDILPLYVLFMVVSPALMLHGPRGWAGILAASIALWLAAQFGLGPWLYERFAALAQLRVPVQQTGAFGLLAWQLLWTIGLWMGVRHARGLPVAGRFPGWMVAVAVGWALVCLVWRHAIGQTPFPGEAALAPLFDKWELGPLRVLNLFALTVVVMHFGPRWTARLDGAPTLELLGRASLPVFCAHLVATLLALTFFGAADPARPVVVDTFIVAATFVGLFAVAWISDRPWWRPAVLRAT